MFEVLENLSKKHKESMVVIRATHGFIAASYMRWHDEEEAVKEFEEENS